MDHPGSNQETLIAETAMSQEVSNNGSRDSLVSTQTAEPARTTGPFTIPNNEMPSAKEHDVSDSDAMDIALLLLDDPLLQDREILQNVIHKIARRTQNSRPVSKNSDADNGAGLYSTIQQKKLFDVLSRQLSIIQGDPDKSLSSSSYIESRPASPIIRDAPHSQAFTGDPQAPSLPDNNEHFISSFIKGALHGQIPIGNFQELSCQRNSHHSRILRCQIMCLVGGILGICLATIGGTNSER
jgi:hypothetical protein